MFPMFALAMEFCRGSDAGEGYEGVATSPRKSVTFATFGVGVAKDSGESGQTGSKHVLSLSKGAGRGRQATRRREHNRLRGV